MREVAARHDVGVIVGRFQVPELHEAHTELIQHVCEQHEKVLIFLGLSPIPGTRENPLDFESRRQMLSEAFPNVNVLYIKDMSSDDAWSSRLDGMVADLTTPDQTVCLYGGRESFINHYRGTFPTCELESDTYVNAGTEIRKQIARGRTNPTVDFRRGVVWNAHNRFPTCFVTVDVAVWKTSHRDEVLLVRKPDEKLWRLPGGFIQPGTPFLEANARREVQEEAGIAITDPKYVGSFEIDDWRYRGETDKIMTVLFEASYLSGRLHPDDDVEAARWSKIAQLAISDIVPNHRPLVEAVFPAHSQR